jgi:hypothetical protein
VGYVIGDLAGYRAADLSPVVSEAFAGYVIPLRADAASLDALLTRRGWEPAWSFGLFRQGRLARCGAQLTLSQDEMCIKAPGPGKCPVVPLRSDRSQHDRRYHRTGSCRGWAPCQEAARGQQPVAR